MGGCYLPRCEGVPPSLRGYTPLSARVYCPLWLSAINNSAACIAIINSGCDKTSGCFGSFSFDYHKTSGCFGSFSFDYQKTSGCFASFGFDYEKTSGCFGSFSFDYERANDFYSFCSNLRHFCGGAFARLRKPRQKSGEGFAFGR